MDHLASINPTWSQVAPNDIIDGFGRHFNVANGGFEFQAPFGGFGWRYRLDGVERVHDPTGAAEGSHYIRLEPGEQVHQPIDATGDALPGATLNGQVYYVSAMIRGTPQGAVAQINADFEGQQLYNRANGITRSFTVNPNWQRYHATFTAPDGTWKTFFILRSDAGTVEFDDVRVSNGPLITGALPADSTFRLSWQSAADATYQIQATEDFSNWNVLDTIIGSGTVVTGDTEISGHDRRFFRLHTLE